MADYCLDLCFVVQAGVFVVDFDFDFVDQGGEGGDEDEDVENED